MTHDEAMKTDPAYAAAVRALVAAGAKLVDARDGFLLAQAAGRENDPSYFPPVWPRDAQ